MKLNRKYQSDRRKKGGEYKECILCKETTQLRLSHIVPKWAYKYLKSESPKNILLGSYESIDSEVVAQDGTKKYLLCEKCEQHIGLSENYMKVLMNGTYDERRNKDIELVDNKVVSYNAELIHRFMYSLMLKIHHCEAAPFHKTNIHEDVIEEVHKHLQASTIDSSRFLIVATEYFSKQHPAVNPKGMIIHDYKEKKGEPFFFSILFSGWEWLVFFNTFKEMPYDIVVDSFLDDKWPLRILTGDIMENRLIQKVLSKMK